MMMMMIMMEICQKGFVHRSVNEASCDDDDGDGDDDDENHDDEDISKEVPFTGL